MLGKHIVVSPFISIYFHFLPNEEPSDITIKPTATETDGKTDREKTGGLKR